ncbi:MAG: hypothetical protein R3F30_14455 [Planctomycetota bacterium]
MMFAVAFLLAFAPAQDTPDEGLRVQVRVRDADGQRVPGAEVFFAAADLAAVDRQQAPEVLRYACDDRGNLVAVLPGGRSWGAWAVHDEGRRRFASAWVERGVGSGEVELVVEPFPVPFVRLQNTAGWRARFDGELSVVYVSRSGPAPRFELPFPERDGVVQHLPPLPNDHYFPVLVHRRLGLLDTAYFAPWFHDGEATAEKLYERDYPLKRFVLGAPVRLHGRVVDEAGTGVAGAVVEVGPGNGIPLALRQRVRSDAQGGYELWVPWKPSELRTRYESEVVVHATGQAPRRVKVDGLDDWLAQQPVSRADGAGGDATAGPDLELRLASAATLHWTLPCFDRARGDRLLLRSKVADDQGGQDVEVLEVEVGDGGRLALPGVPAAREEGAVKARFGGALDGPFELVLVRDGRPVRLFSRTAGHLPLEHVLPAPREVRLAARRDNGHALPGGELELRMVGEDPRKVMVQLDREGRADVLLVPGAYLAAVRHARLGEGWTRFDVPVRDEVAVPPVDVGCRPYLRRSARVDADDQEGLRVQLGMRVLDYAPGLPRELQPWIREGLTEGVLPVNVPIGRRFTLRLSPFIAGYELSALGRSDLGWLRAQESASIDEAGELRLDLR